MLTALREIGLLDEIDTQRERVVTYPGAKLLQAATQIVEIRAVWWHYYRLRFRASRFQKGRLGKLEADTPMEWE